jgi:hypothetical protein
LKGPGVVEMATAAPTRSTTIALTSDETRLVVGNREANTLSVIRVKDDNGNDVATKLAEWASRTSPIEIRDNAAASTAFGADGFNVPSLLGVNYTAPYLHRGQAQTLEKVFWLHKLTAAGGVPIPTDCRFVGMLVTTMDTKDTKVGPC